MLDTQDLVQDTILSSLRHLDHFESRHEGALKADLRQAWSTASATKRAVSERSAPRTRRLTAFGRGIPARDRYRPRRGRTVRGRAAAIEAGGSRSDHRPDRDATDYQEIAITLDKPTADAARVAVTRALARLMEQFDEPSTP